MALTKYPSGSVREMCAIALPLMISSFSMMMMLFTDRLMIAQYSTEALTAVISAATLGWSFAFAGFVLAGISEVFVAQHNGAGRKNRLGEPVWQMLWLSLFSGIVYFSLAYFGAEKIYGEERLLEQTYFSWMMFFTPASVMYSALCGFFVGQGKIFLITVLAVAANICNVVLDYSLIFGVEGWIPSMGVEGAAIATCGSSLFQAGVLLFIFLNAKNRKECNTGRWYFVWDEFCRCLRFGMPAAVFATVEILAWASYYQLMADMSDHHILVAGICQTIVILFYFIAEGVNKAASTISGNLIGAGQQQEVHKVISSGMKLLALFYAVLFVLFVCGRHFVFPMFMPHASSEEIEFLYFTMMFAMGVMVVSMFFEGLRMLYAGVLTAAGDTNFLMWVGSLSIWAMMILPIYMFVVRTGGSIEQAVSIVGFYNVLASGIYAARFYVGRWKNIRVVGEGVTIASNN